MGWTERMNRLRTGKQRKDAMSRQLLSASHGGGEPYRGEQRDSACEVVPAIVLFGLLSGEARQRRATATASPDSAAGSGLRPIDQHALQALLDKTARELHVPGAVRPAAHTAGRVHGRLRHHAVGRADRPARVHPFPDRVDHQDDDVGGDPAAGPGGQAAARRPVSKYVPGVPERRQHHPRRAAGDAQRPVQTTPTPQRSRRAWTTTRPGCGRRRNCWPSRSRSRRISRPGTVRVQQHQLRAARPDHREGGRQAAGDGVPGPVVRAARHERTRCSPPATSNTIPEPYSHGYLYGSSSVVHVPARTRPTPRRCRPRRGRDAPAEGLHRHQPLLRLRGRGRHLHRRRSRHLDAGTGRRQGAQRQVPAHLAGQPEAGPTTASTTGTASTGFAGDTTTSISTAARLPATTRRRATTRSTS